MINPCSWSASPGAEVDGDGGLLVAEKAVRLETPGPLAFDNGISFYRYIYAPQCKKASYTWFLVSVPIVRAYYHYVPDHFESTLPKYSSCYQDQARLVA